MYFCDLIRGTVLTTAAGASALAAIAILVAQSDDDRLTLLVCAVWWPLALVAGLLLGRPKRAADAMRPLLAKSRTSTELPTDRPERIALARLWPIGGFALVGGVLGIFFPGVAAVGAGYGIAVAMSWRGREGAVHAIEGRDGVRFYVEPGSTFEPVSLVRSPGLKRGPAAGQPRP
jgi:hypothetical protein